MFVYSFSCKSLSTFLNNLLYGTRVLSNLSLIVENSQLRLSISFSISSNARLLKDFHTLSIIFHKLSISAGENTSIILFATANLKTSLSLSHKKLSKFLVNQSIYSFRTFFDSSILGLFIFTVSFSIDISLIHSGHLSFSSKSSLVI
ncbi:MAG: hypothetical protein U9Q66_00920 [Patescibacteria group bacterium]|nr:hypothetical protein [Patescibacteria group bacterium]